MFNPDELSASYQPAAVLIPVLKRGNGYTVLFTKRTAHLHAHGGQISFPGGRADAQDKDAVATALREAAEEIGLLPQHVTVLGTLDPYIIGTGFRVVPVVGLVETPPEWMPDKFEVEAIFEVPISYILSPGNLSRQTVMQEGTEQHYYAMTWNNFYIWGATAGMLRNFVEVITHE